MLLPGPSYTCREGTRMRSRACEVVTSDCKCYRWEYNERITNHPAEIQTSQSRTRAGCAMVVYEPQETRELTTVDLMYTLETHYPTPPASYYYVMQERYSLYLKKTRNPVAFTTYFYKTVDAFCKAAGKQKKVPHVASRCDKRFLLAIVPVNLADAKTPVTNHIISPLIMGTHLAGFLGLLLHLVSFHAVVSFSSFRLLTTSFHPRTSLNHPENAAMTEEPPFSKGTDFVIRKSSGSWSALINCIKRTMTLTK